MAWYRHELTTVEAVQWTREGRLSETPGWIQEAMHTDPGTPGNIFRWENNIQVFGAEGVLMVAGPGDWIIRGPQGGLYVCPEAWFLRWYIPVVAVPPTETLTAP